MLSELDVEQRLGEMLESFRADGKPAFSPGTCVQVHYARDHAEAHCPDARMSIFEGEDSCANVVFDVRRNGTVFRRVSIDFNREGWLQEIWHVDDSDAVKVYDVPVSSDVLIKSLKWLAVVEATERGRESSPSSPPTSWAIATGWRLVGAPIAINSA